MPEYSGQVIADPYTGPVVLDKPAAQSAGGMGQNDFMGSTPQSAEQQRNLAVLVNSTKGGMGQAVDQMLNTPNRILNLGKAGVGTIAGLMGKPDWMPDVSPDPNFAQRGLNAIGFTHPELAPQTGTERVLDATGRGAGGMMVMPASGIAGMGANAVMGAASGGLGQATTEATGSPAAGTAVAMGVPAAAAGASALGQRLTADATTRLSQKQPLVDTMNQVRDAGYVMPPAMTNPTAVNRLLESIAGKAATQQDASLRNQGTTDRLARSALGLPADAPLTEASLNDFRDQAAQPYRDVAALPQPATPIVGNAPRVNNPMRYQQQPGQPAYGPQPQSPMDAVTDLKQARFDANLKWNEFKRTGEVAARDAAVALDNKVGGIETYLQDTANQAGRPDLIDAMAQARTQIAKSYDIQRALNSDRGEVSALDLAKAPYLTGDLATAGAMSNSFKKAVNRPENVGSPGVNNLTALLSGAGGGATGAFLGGAPGAAIGSIAGAAAPQTASMLARKLILSGPYQRSLGTPNFGQGPVSSMASAVGNAMPTQTPSEVIMRALMAQRLQGNQQ